MVQSISHRLSLRPPQTHSLEILAAVADRIPLKKAADVVAALDAVKKDFPTVESFERDFPSLCFALATGVGKTRLMGAFIAYLHAQKGIRHFFVLAPNLTIYDKLKTDFTPNTPKYVFQGIAEFASNPPLVITGDNYENQRVVRRVEARKGQTSLFDDTVHINVFNISKLNKDASEKKGTPRIKRLSEYIGQSYFDYLAELHDLVLLMDESHRYRADAGVRVLNELRPVLGLELTATPQVESAQRAIPFKNIVYSYPLSKALEDGFVKEPAVATRKDFDAKSYTPEQLELLKLEDAIRVHETVKVDLEVYGRETGQPAVKPFVLVIAADTDHASAIEKTIKSDEFFAGRYRDRVITVHSNKTGEEKDEVVQRLVDVEKSGEPTEIVIHVNMLKEGWDVTNLYTIVPLRAANSKTLIEQSIGRGLRLPFGKRTGVKAIDRLTIIAHDRFQSIIDEAQKPDSVIRTGLVIGVDIPPAGQKAVIVPPAVETKLFGLGASERGSDGSPKPVGGAVAAAAITKPEEVEVARRVLDQIKRASRDPVRYPTVASLGSDDGQASMVRDVIESYGGVQPALPGFEHLVKHVVSVVTTTVAAGTIGIPRIVVVPTGEVTSGYHDFDLDTASLGSLKPVDKAILVKHLRDTSVLDEIGVGDEGPPEERLEDYIIRALIDYDDIDYQTQSALLNKLAEQAVAHLRATISEPGGVRNVVLYFQRTLAKVIHAQMQADGHFWQSATAYEAKVHQGFATPPDVTYPVPADEGLTDFRAPVEQKRDIKNMIFGGFRKCLYLAQKFDADPERRFAVVLEDDATVAKWFKPARRAFQIDYLPGAAYEPDFVVETGDEKFMVEVKRADQLEHPDVLQKAKAAIEWCKNATDHEKRHAGKPWRYLMIPHDAINEGVSLKGLAARFTKS